MSQEPRLLPLMMCMMLVHLQEIKRAGQELLQKTNLKLLIISQQAEVLRNRKEASIMEPREMVHRHRLQGQVAVVMISLPEDQVAVQGVQAPKGALEVAREALVEEVLEVAQGVQALPEGQVAVQGVQAPKEVVVRLLVPDHLEEVQRVREDQDNKSSVL